MTTEDADKRKRIISHDSGLVQIPQGENLWALGYFPAKKTFCIGGLSDGLADMYEDNEQVIVRYKEGQEPTEIFLVDPDYTPKPNEVRVVFGSFFVVGSDVKKLINETH